MDVRTQIFSWEARRSGGRITINGRDAAGAPTRVAAIDSIERFDGVVVATHKSGAEYELVV